VCVCVCALVLCEMYSSLFSAMQYCIRAIMYNNF
jgi:hypothetical protein